MAGHHILSGGDQPTICLSLGGSRGFEAEEIEMGAWSHEPFGNDDANDWAHELEGAEDLSRVEAALDAVLEAHGYVEAPAGSRAVAAVEVIAKLLEKGTQSDSYTVKVDQWVKRVHVKPTRPLLEKARRALDRIRSDQSELKQLWHKADASDWESTLNSLYAVVNPY